MPFFRARHTVIEAHQVPTPGDEGYDHIEVTTANGGLMIAYPGDWIVQHGSVLQKRYKAYSAADFTALYEPA